MSWRSRTGFSRVLTAGIALASVLTFAVVTRGEEELTLKREFIEKYKNKITIDATYTVDKAHAHPNPAAKDGDMHIAGRAPEIGLPTVAEIMNAKNERAAVKLVHDVEGTGKTIAVSGVWRLWAEHGGNAPQVQDQRLDPFNTTNPEHFFEIHPLTQVGGNSVLGSLVPIAGYKEKDAEEAFSKYESLKCKLVPGTATVAIFTEMAGFNYAEFSMLIVGDQEVVDDGRFIFAEVQALDGETLLRHRRMAFVKDSPPEEVVKGLKTGDKLHVIGIPRIDLALVSYRVKNGTQENGMLTWNLPYEMVVVAVVKQLDSEPVETQFNTRRHKEATIKHVKDR